MPTGILHSKLLRQLNRVVVECLFECVEGPVLLFDVVVGFYFLEMISILMIGE